MSDVDWNSLQFALAVARHGSLERAALQLGVDPSTVSRKLHALEQDIGTRIFDRTTSGHRATAIGHMMLKAAEQVESSIAGMARLADSADDRLGGIVRIGASAVVARELAPLITRFCQRHPLVRFDLRSDLGTAALVRHEIDLTIRLDRPEQAQLASRRLTTVGFGIYASVGYLEAHPFDGVKSIERHRLLGYRGDRDFGPGRTWFDKHAPGGDFVLRASSLDAIHGAAADGLGLAVLPCYLADPDPRLVRLLGPDQVLRRDVWLVIHRDLRRTARLRAFADFVCQELRQQAGALQGAVLAAG